MADQKEFLGTAPIGKLLLKLSIPTVVAQLINMLYNIVDRVYIGRITPVETVGAESPTPKIKKIPAITTTTAARMIRIFFLSTFAVITIILDPSISELAL